VNTPFGKGLILKIRSEDGIYVVTLLNWKLATDKSPVLYLNKSALSKVTNNVIAIDAVKIEENIETSQATVPKFVVGSQVNTPFGKGEILKIRGEDEIYVVTLLNWKLATDKSPVLYLNKSALSEVVVKVDDTPKVDPMIAYVEDNIAKSKECRDKAKDFFQKGDYENAKENYINALNCLRYFDDNLSNDQKAEVFLQTVPCYNNVAVCCMRLKSYNDCALFANNTFMLINALQGRIPDGNVWKSLLNFGLTLPQLMEYKKKSLFFMGKAEFLNNEFELSKTHLEEALKLTPSDAVRDKATDELKDILAKTTKKLQEQRKKEKSTWSKAFKKNTEVAEEVLPVKQPTVDPIPTVTPKETEVTGEKKKQSKKDVDSSKEKKNNGTVSTFLSNPSTLSGIFFFGCAVTALYYFSRTRRFR